ncbi:glycosyltransferase [Synechococcus elongatus]|uniref:glycosyltransferase n=1 Tax=Synechococcus elongatus TaxID=32046 RepID=UPI000F7DC638|nr:glycosyltransferase [Synechococcus elongatus]
MRFPNFLQRSPQSNLAPSQVSPGAWLFLAISIAVLVFALLSLNLSWLQNLPGYLNPQNVRDLPESLSFPEDPRQLFQPLLLVAGLLLSLRILPHHPISHLLVLLTLLLYGIRYFTWRLFALNNGHIFSLTLSIIFLLTESLYVLSFLMQFYPTLVFDPKRRSRQADQQEALLSKFSPSVAIWIPIYNEHPRIIRRTILACQLIDYENKEIYVLDDGHRSEIRAIATELGVHYLSRPDNTHRKAGNLNYALNHTNSDLIAVFDCDFLPFNNFLKRTVGFFANEEIALVQTPQHYYNSDFHTRNLGLDYVLPNDMDYFFHYIQPIRDQFNSVICCGTSYVARRSALEDVGGYYTDCIVEDFQTGTKLLLNHWRVVYLNEVLSIGEVPRHLSEYLQQRLRWMQGNIQLYCSHKHLPIWSGRLTTWQRLFYLSILIYCLTPFMRAIYILLPLLSFLFGFTLIAAPPIEYFYYGLPFILLIYGATSWLTYNHYFLYWTEIYESIMCWPSLQRIIQVLFNPFGNFGSLVTAKGELDDRKRFNLKISWPFIAYLSLFGLGFGLRYVAPLLSPYFVRPSFEGEALMMIWNFYNAMLMSICLFACVDQPIRRRFERYPYQAVACLEVNGHKFWGMTQDLSEGGASFILRNEQELQLIDEQAELVLLQEDLRIPVNVLRMSREAFNGHSQVGLEFQLSDTAAEKTLIRLLYVDSSLWWQQIRRSSAIDAFLVLIRSALNPRALLTRYNNG